MSPPYPVSAVIFDLDGTLLDTLEDLYLSTNVALSHAGYPTRTRQEVRRFVGHGVEMLIRRAVPAGTEEVACLSVLADFKAHYAATCHEHTAPYPGVIELLDALLAKGISCAVVSNKFDAAVKELSARYFGERIAVAVGERAGVRKKPAPDTVWEALRALGVDAADCVYIGDSEVDIETARASKMACITVTWGFRDRETLLAAGASQLIDSAASLKEYLLP